MKYYIVLLIVLIILLTITLYFTYLPVDQPDGISEWNGTPNGMIGINFDKCEKTKGSNIIYDDLPVCYLPDGTSYQIDE